MLWEYIQTGRGEMENERVKRLRINSKRMWAIGGQVLIVCAEVLIQISLNGASWFLRAGALAPAVLILYFIWRLHVHPYLAFAESYVVVENVLATYRIPYRMIESCEGKRSLLIRVTGRGVIPVLAFDASFLGGRRKSATQEELLHRINAADLGGRETFSKATGTGTLDILAISSVFLLAAFYWVG
jgi:hypothetical protein